MGGHDETNDKGSTGLVKVQQPPELSVPLKPIMQPDWQPLPRNIMHPVSFRRPRWNPASAPGAGISSRSKAISVEQLVAEVKSIYAGLVMIESKCIQVDRDGVLAQATPRRWLEQPPPAACHVHASGTQATDLGLQQDDRPRPQRRRRLRIGSAAAAVAAGLPLQPQRPRARLHPPSPPG